MFRARGTASLLLLFLTIVSSSVARGDEEPRFDFHIESQPLADALAAFGRQAHFDVLYSIAPGASALRTPSLIGRFTVQEALLRLLAGTEGDYVKVADDMIVFRVPEPGSSR